MKRGYHQPTQGAQTVRGSAGRAYRDDFKRRSRVYGAAAATSYLIKRINVGTSWASRMKDHWLAFPGMPLASATQGGFLPAWDQEAIWA